MKMGKLVNGSSLSKIMYLDPAKAYYIRKLLRQNFDRLQSVVAQGAGLSIDPLSDLNAVIESLYLEDDEIQSTTAELQRLVIIHQQLSEKSPSNRQSLPDVEARIFWLLGFKEKTPGRKEMILVVDDLADNRVLLEGALKHQGYRVATANDGMEALKQARTLRPHVILLDIKMPGMDGFQVCQTLKESQLTSSIPVLFLSANTSAQDKVKGFEVGGVDYITKPFHFEEVFARVEYQLKLKNLQIRLAQQNETLQKEILAHQDTEERYRSMFDHAVDGMFQSSAYGNYITANKALARIYGYPSPESLMGAVKDIATQLYVDPDRRSEFITAINGDGTLTNFESQIYCRDGSTIWISESARMVYNKAGKFLHYEGIVRDISQYKPASNHQDHDNQASPLPAQQQHKLHQSNDHQPSQVQDAVA